MWKKALLCWTYTNPDCGVDVNNKFDDPGGVDFRSMDWVVIGTMTGAQSRKVRTWPEWVYSLTDQAHALAIPVFWKEDLAPIMGEDLVQELPDAYNKVLEEQKKWHKS